MQLDLVWQVFQALQQILIQVKKTKINVYQRVLIARELSPPAPNGKLHFAEQSIGSISQLSQ